MAAIYGDSHLAKYNIHRVKRLQKKPANKPTNNPTNTIFQNLKLLKVKDTIKLQQLKLIYRYTDKSIPEELRPCSPSVEIIPQTEY